MHCRESVDVPLDEMHITSRQRFKVDVPSGSFDAKRPGRYPLRFMLHAAEYYQRDLSYPSDALNAMQGIFRSFEEQLEKRKVYNVVGIPILPQRVQGLAVQTPLHSLLTGLFWYHLEPGQRRVQFPSWSWAGWESGSISAESFVSVNESTSKLHPETAVWIEERPGLLRSFKDILDQRTSGSIHEDIYFLHIETWTTTCTIVYLTPTELPEWNMSPSFYARFSTDNKTVNYAKIYPSINADKLRERTSENHPHQFLGLFLPFSSHAASIHYIDRWASVLVVEDKGDSYERVGVCHLYSCYSKDYKTWSNDSFCVDRDGSKSTLKDWFSRWEKAPKTKRSVRLG